jgi:hypothetical protein
MHKIILLLLTTQIFAAMNWYAQQYTHRDLSYKFDYEINAVRKKDSDGMYRTAKIFLTIYNKHKKAIQKINLNTPFLFEDAYKNCNRVRSYINGYKKDAEAFDYDFGDLIIADLNFDGKEDIAIKYNSGGNGGPVYNFYLQDNTGHFRMDHFLTDTMVSFPKYIDIKHKILTTQIHANVHQEGKKLFKYNPKTKKWHLVKWVMVEY